MEVQKIAAGQICTELFSQNLVTTLGYQKSSLFACRWSENHPKFENSIAICSFIKAPHGCQESSSSYQYNSLDFESKKPSVITTLIYFWYCLLLSPYSRDLFCDLNVRHYALTDSQIYLICVTQSIQGAIMLNPIEKFKVAIILHMKRDWNHCTEPLQQ